MGRSLDFGSDNRNFLIYIEIFPILELHLASIINLLTHYAKVLYAITLYIIFSLRGWFPFFHAYTPYFCARSGRCRIRLPEPSTLVFKGLIPALDFPLGEALPFLTFSNFVRHYFLNLG
ncbi:hypothetical protein BB561_000037 [Smittium simulii]|uniref:Uncharacterized protein n=1 Tax=Smittium simulii TaxID=133385 RepID=A0A2T9Z0Z6_9FUNG|nr:hypothetical protein BB561_000037 [Smittium simulii]